jgi:4-hydroxybenzoyl-CoA reductase subunit beta
MMRLPPFRYVAPRTAREAARLLADHGPESMAVAGGTDLFPNMKRRQFMPKILVALRNLDEASGLHVNGGLDIGALATLSEVAASPVVNARWPAVARSAVLPSATA